MKRCNVSFAGMALSTLWAGCGGPADGTPDLGPGAGQGAIEVRWSLEKQDGVPTECGEVNVALARIDVAGRAEDVPCGEDERVRFSMLTPGRYPVRIQLLNANDGIVDTYSDMATVEADSTAVVETTFQLSGTGPSTGDLILTWTVDGEPASVGCARVDGDRVEITAELGSIDPEPGGTLPCAAGRAEFEDVRIGGYVMRARLRSPAGDSLALDQDTIQVAPSQEVVLPMNFSVTTSQPATLYSQWTVDGLSADPGCEARGAEKVQARVQRLNADLQYVTVATSTGSCEPGRLRTEGLATSMGAFRVIYDLIDTSLADDLIISSTVAEQISLRPASTTTVTVDFPFQD